MKTQRKNSKPEDILKAIKNSNNILTIMDYRFDYDNVCSVLMMNTFLKSLNKSYGIFYAQNIPNYAKKILQEDLSEITINEGYDLNSIDYKEYDLMIFLDTGNIQHINKEYTYQAPKDIKIISIDHHLGETTFGHLNYFGNMPTSAILFDLFERWNYKMDKKTAIWAMIGLLTDTGYLQYSNTFPETLRAAAHLIECGANISEIAQRLRVNDSLESIGYKAFVYSNIKVDDTYKFAYVIITLENIRNLNIKVEELQPTSDMFKYLDATDFVFTIKEVTPVSVYNISFRSRLTNYDVAKIANKLGGAGHKNAAGANVTANSPEKCLELVRKALDEIKSGENGSKK